MKEAIPYLKKRRAYIITFVPFPSKVMRHSTLIDPFHQCKVRMEWIHFGAKHVTFLFLLMLLMIKNIFGVLVLTPVEMHDALGSSLAN